MTAIDFEQTLSKELEHALEDNTKPIEPKLYIVRLHNDDYTTMEFVVEILQKMLHKSAEQAYQLMMKIHKEGQADCAIYPHDIAETKRNEIKQAALSAGFPLLCTICPSN